MTQRPHLYLNPTVAQGGNSQPGCPAVFLVCPVLQARTSRPSGAQGPQEAAPASLSKGDSSAAHSPAPAVQDPCGMSDGSIKRD